MFLAVQMFLRNMLIAARALMKLTNETYELYLRIIDLLSDKRAVRLGLGEEIASVGATATVESDRISVAADVAAAKIVIVKYSYATDLIIRDVVIQGTGVSFEVKKTNTDASVTTFTQNQLPLRTNNFTLEITVAPGGFYQKAAVLQEIIV